MRQGNYGSDAMTLRTCLFLGSTSIIPGRFNPWGTLLAVYFLVTGITGLIFMGVSTFVQDIFYGAALVLAVTLSQIVRGREEQQF